MQEVKPTVVGVDISKAYFDYFFTDADSKKTKGRLINDKLGFQQLQKIIPSNSWVVMEASGPYYYQLACFLYGKGIKVAVVNPLVIRRFMQMQLQRAKTDSADAKGIAAFGKLIELKPWQPLKESYLKIKQWYTIRKQLLKHLHATTQQMEAFLAAGKLDKNIKTTLEEEIRQLNKKISHVEKQMNELIEEENSALKEQLESIPGIGPKTSLLLIVALRGFENFNNYKQVISYLGLSPRIYESGSSVRGKSRICKMGMSEVRKCLYMAARSARKYNTACKELYERLRTKGKAHRVAMIAVVNKLLKQAFAIVEAGTLFEKDYQPKQLETK
jgi:transposase